MQTKRTKPDTEAGNKTGSKNREHGQGRKQRAKTEYKTIQQRNKQLINKQRNTGENNLTIKISYWNSDQQGKHEDYQNKTGNEFKTLTDPSSAAISQVYYLRCVTSL